MYVEENTDLSEDELNTIRATENDKNYSFIKIVDIHKLYDKYHNSNDFREKLLRKGYKILTLYDCYHQGWEGDEWGAIVEKEGKKYWVETNHGAFEFIEQKNIILDIVSSIFKRVMK